MELDEFKTAWAALDRRFERQRTWSLQLVRDGRLQTARCGLYPLWIGQIIQILAGLGITLQFAPNWLAHRDTLHLMIPALIMHAYGLMLVIFGARTLALLVRIDYAAPVLQIQRRLAELARWRARVEWPLFAIAGCFVWIPLMLLAFNALGVDLWVVNPRFVYWNIVAGFVALGLVFSFRRWMRKRGLDPAGGRLRRAQQELEKIARFEEESL